MRFFFDCEFIEEPGHLDLISIGIVSEDGRELYCESSEVDWSRANDWVLENVRPHLTGETVPRTEIREQILAFIGDDVPEFWSAWADYDWVCFCWLFGTMSDLPEGWPQLCLDLKQWSMAYGDPPWPKPPADEHHALVDARWHRDIHRKLARIQSWAG